MTVLTPIFGKGMKRIREQRRERFRTEPVPECIACYVSEWWSRYPSGPVCFSDRALEVAGTTRERAEAYLRAGRHGSVYVGHWDGRAYFRPASALARPPSPGGTTRSTLRLCPDVSAVADSAAKDPR
jgi:hypothetical protein